MPPPASSQLLHPELGVRNGPILIGFTIDCMLFGLLIAQFCIYIRNHKWHRDGYLMQSLVYLLCFVELFRLVVVVQSVWGLLIKQQASPGRFAASTPLAVALPSLAGFESSIVQIFFAWRIWSMKRGECPYWTAATIIALIAVMQTAGSIGLSYQLHQIVTGIHDRVHLVSVFTTVWLAGSFVCDLLIVSAMALILMSVRKEATFRDTERLINYLLRLTVESGALTVLAAAIMLALHLKYPRNSYCLGILYILGGLYINILLYLLNSRQKSFRNETYNNEISLHLAPVSQMTHTTLSTSTNVYDASEFRRGSKE